MNQNIPPPPMAGVPPPPPQRPSAKPVKKMPATMDAFEKMGKDVNTIGANLRILEERFVLMRNKSQVSEGGMIELERGLSKDLKMINDDILDLKHELKDIMDKLMLINNEMKNLTKKEEFKVIERYLDMWQPMEFLTRKEFDRLIEEKGIILRTLPSSFDDSPVGSPASTAPKSESSSASKPAPRLAVAQRVRAKPPVRRRR
ncbi:hypothetical protein JW711_03685 [Candidatus Woesearchaeota archaeon]|nr:hypothetical protein [Candidatus Woesearchaeota archaeon]